MARSTLSLASLLFLMSCSPANPNKALEDDAIAALSDSFTDFREAHIRFTEVNSRARVICGVVNGRNKFGGYTGERDFAYSGALAYIYPDQGRDFLKWAAVCDANGSQKINDEITTASTF